jgi:hypothetical protein
MMSRKASDFHTIRGRNHLTRFPGICAAARDLGVTRGHLWYVLRGERRSPRIERSRYFKRVAGGAA